MGKPNFTPNQQQETFVKHHNRKDAAEAIRLQLILHDETRCKMHVFIAFCMTTALNFLAIIWLFCLSLPVETINIAVLSTLLIALMSQSVLLYQLRRYNPISVRRRMLYEHDYGAIASAMKSTAN